jgi:hypothetical protein
VAGSGKHPRASARGRGGQGCVGGLCVIAPKMSRRATFSYCQYLNVEQVAPDGFYRIAGAKLFAAHKAMDGRFHGRH